MITVIKRKSRKEDGTDQDEEEYSGQLLVLLPIDFHFNLRLTNAISDGSLVTVRSAAREERG